ncbi:hypothetical protein NPIL_114451 [Nephila pilipes]|uniref:Uncharacterized protein n=1 Tax=Nephila pilipes TaxID=299642 RepID=A0A8X6QXA9_NEPPI|nr:hypothetical protein NPIL_114451 [Nephila pilipes]
MSTFDSMCFQTEKSRDYINSTIFFYSSSVLIPLVQARVYKDIRCGLKYAYVSFTDLFTTCKQNAHPDYRVRCHRGHISPQLQPQSKVEVEKYQP